MIKRRKRVLNLYAGLGGNRKLWQNVKVVAVEWDERIAKIYSELYPRDKVVVANAHEYLLDHFSRFDYIWSSPPCLTHSGIRQELGVATRCLSPCYIDTNLYQEIIFLQYNFDGFWCVENVRPYYEPLVKPTFKLQRHYFWTNYPVPRISLPKDEIEVTTISKLQKHHDIFIPNWYGIKTFDKRQMLRNCVYPKLGRHIFNSAYNNKNILQFLKGKQ